MSGWTPAYFYWYRRLFWYESTVKQEVKIIIKKPTDRTGYEDKLTKEKINITLPVFAELYENSTKAIDISSRLII